MSRSFAVILTALVALSVSAQSHVPCGAYEGADKNEGVVRQIYLEINLEEPVVPDFSQTFTKGKDYAFQLLPADFMKKPSGTFKGQKAHGFVKYRSKYALANTEVCRLSDPERTADGWKLAWKSDYGKSGTCELHIVNDTTLRFTGLGYLSKSLSCDGLLLTKVQRPAAQKDYLTPRSVPQPKAPESPSPEAGKPSAEAPFAPSVDGEGNVLMPKSNTGSLRGEWVGASGILLKVDALSQRYEYGGERYYGIIRLDGPGYIHEGVVRVQQLAADEYILYTIPLDTDFLPIHWLRVKLPAPGDPFLQLWPTGGPRELDQMGKELRKVIFYGLCPVQPHYVGRFTTGREVQPFRLDFLERDYRDNGTGSQTYSHGCVTSSFNSGSYIDHDVILSTSIDERGNVNIEYRCGRTDNLYKAILVYNAAKKSYLVREVKRLSGEDDDCALPTETLKYLGN